MTTAELGYFTFSVADLEKAKGFYGELFGWRFEPGNMGEGYAHVNNTDMPLGFTSHGASDRSHLYFRVPDLDTAMDRVKKLGGNCNEPFESESGRGAACTDDQGTKFSLWQAAAGY